MSETQFPCGQCGARVQFQPGTGVLTCPYCNHDNPIESIDVNIDEIDYEQVLARLEQNEDTVEQQIVTCNGCGGETTLAPNITAGACAFCGNDVVAAAKSAKSIKPKALLPFRVTRDEAKAAFRKWVDGLWFAPNALKKFSRLDTRLAGMYVPYWTYDADADSSYTGQRGDAYYVTQSYTTTVDGKSVTRTRQVRKIRWTWVSGRVLDEFDDILVLASTTLQAKYANKLEPWDLQNLEPYQDDYLSGFQAESYHVTLPEGFRKAQAIMEGHIRAHVTRDIGGDEQRISSLDTRLDEITFKHVLLPVWMSAYQYRAKSYRFLINGRTGEVQGERPWSIWKITFAVLGVIALIAAIALIASNS